MKFRTDLALERREILDTQLNGVTVTEKYNNECKITEIKINTESAARKLGKGIGKYITIEMNSFSDEAAVSEGRLNALVEGIKALLPKKEGAVLVAGVGNSEMTSDALGPFTASKVFATRHISDELRKCAGINASLRPVVSLSTGVMGQTGIESGEFIKSICDTVKPCCVITIDALAAGSISRLGRTVQMSNTGISPGSGVGNSRKRIDEEYLGVPVIAIGVPTVVDSLSLACEICGVSEEQLNRENVTQADGLVVAPKDVDLLVKNAAYILALSINCALQPQLTTKELYAFM